MACSIKVNFAHLAHKLTTSMIISKFKLFPHAFGIVVGFDCCVGVGKTGFGKTLVFIVIYYVKKKSLNNDIF